MEVTMSTYKSKDSAMRAARKRGLTAESVEQLPTGQWSIKGSAPAKKSRRQPSKALKVVEKAKDTGALRALDKIAKEINTRMEKASQIETQAGIKADDHRLAAAIRLGEAKEQCKKIKLPFKRWCEEKITLGYTYAVALSQVGLSPDPKAALEDMRSGTRASVKKADTKKRAAKKVTLDSESSVTPKRSKLEVAESAIADLGEEGAKRLIEDRASKAGLVVVPKSEAAKPISAKENGDPLEALKAMFSALDERLQKAFATWAADQAGLSLSQADADSGALEIPAAFKRSSTKAKAAT
jgi:hypothetical protein